MEKSPFLAGGVREEGMIKGHFTKGNHLLKKGTELPGQQL